MQQKASPTFTGTETLPNGTTIDQYSLAYLTSIPSTYLTTSSTTPSTQISGLTVYAPLASPIFTGTVKLPNGSTIDQNTAAYLTSIPSTYLTTSSTI